MRVLTVYAHPNPSSFCHAILERFTQGLAAGGHASEVVDPYAIGFDPVFRMEDFASYVHESIPLPILEKMNLKRAYDLGKEFGRRDTESSRERHESC